MAAKRPLGTILQDSGRITQDDVQRVLEHQRTYGGYFGQALVALGILSREELDWALASHFDLPFIFPDADAVDREAARLVPADWALAHLAVPIVRAGRTLTVAVADPLPQEVLDGLRARTGCEVEMALASAARLRELIHVVYAADPSDRSAEGAPLAFGDLIQRVMDGGAERFGISVRGASAMAWWRTSKHASRAPLLDGWEEEVSTHLTPSPLAGAPAEDGGVVNGTLRYDEQEVPVEMRTLSGSGGLEMMFRPLRGDSGLPVNMTLPRSLATELRLLWRSGSARVGVWSEDGDDIRDIVPLLPQLALGAHVRAAHVNRSGEAAGAYTIAAGADAGFARALAAHELDSVTVDLPPSEYPVEQLLRAAPLTFVFVDSPERPAQPGPWGINWVLTVSGRPGSYAWDLRALHG